ncbi:MAG TPA: AraC family transcriptional regulator [Polyangiales bacterium]
MSVSASLARILIEAVARAGADVDGYCAAAGLDRAALEQPLHRIEHAVWMRAIELALAYTDDPELGLHLGERLGPQAFGIVGFVSAQAPTLRESIDALLSYRYLLSDSPPPRLEERGQRAFLPYDYLPGPPAVNRLRAELFVSRFVHLVRAFVGAQGAVEICFAYPAPRYHNAYRRRFGEAVCFDQPRTGLRFPRALLDVPQYHWDPALYRLLREQANLLLADAPNRSVGPRIRLVLLQHREPRPSMREVARRLGATERTLRRQLAAEGTSFREVLDSALRERTLSLLRDQSLTLEEVMARAGFTEASGLYRAVRRWTDLAPAEFRAAQLATPSTK